MTPESCVHKIKTSISGIIINKDNLKIFVVTIQNRAQTFLDEFLSIVVYYHYRDRSLLSALPIYQLFFFLFDIYRGSALFAWLLSFS